MEFISDTTNRLDKFLASKVDVSRVRVQKAIKDGKVTVDGIIILDPDYIVKPGNVISEFSAGGRSAFGGESDDLKPSAIKLKVIFENEYLAVIDKPPGMVVHPGAGNKEDTLANALLTRFPGVEKVGEPHRPGIVHRLDEDTSGLIVIAKTAEGFDYLKKIFLDRLVEKEYLALVHGVPPKKHGIINAPLEKVPLKRRMSVVDQSASHGKSGSAKEAVSEYWVLNEGSALAKTPAFAKAAADKSADRLDEMALLRVKLHTGRTHQIRAHLSYIGHPIAGDSVYGERYKISDKEILNRQFLHAYRLKLQLMDQTWLELTSELPDDLKQVLEKFNIIYP